MMVDSVGFSPIAPANAALDLRGGSAGTAAPVADSGTAPANVATKPATYFSPHIRFDQSLDQLIIQFRNPDTGQVERQYPSRQVIQQYQQIEEQRQAAEAQARRQELSTGQTVKVQVQTDLNGQPVTVKPVPSPPVSPAPVAKAPQPAPASPPPASSGSAGASSGSRSSRGITA